MDCGFSLVNRLRDYSMGGVGKSMGRMLDCGAVGAILIGSLGPAQTVDAMPNASTNNNSSAQIRFFIKGILLSLVFVRAYVLS